MATAEFVERKRCINCTSTALRVLSEGAFHAAPVRDFIAADPWGEDPLQFLNGARWTYVMCQNCGQAFHRRILSPEWNERRFERWMSQAAIAEFEHINGVPDATLGRAQAYVAHILRIEALTKTLRNGGATKLLDFGCGNGEFLGACTMFGFEAIGIDRSTARRSVAGPRVVADFDELHRTGISGLHAATMFEVLEHLDDPLSILKRIRSLVVEGAVLILETPDCSGVSAIETMSDYRKIHPLDHINGFTPQTLRSIAKCAGFCAIDPPAAYVTTSHRRLGKTLAKRLLRKPTTQQYFRASKLHNSRMPADYRLTPDQDRA
jgi:2-polyprenyl-3-methyl-5-hydroxy-6-metoxy-1,4-benzoquinol methylase